MSKSTPAVKATKTIKTSGGKTMQKTAGPGKSFASKVHAGVKGPYATIKK